MRAEHAKHARHAQHAKQVKIGQHYKKHLAAIALVLALAAGSGGTLMLLTDTTPTVTSVMTAGNVEVSLHEYDATGDTTVDAKTNTTVTVGYIVPGQTVTRQPFVKNVGTTNAYVAIELIFSTDGTIASEPDVEGNNTEALYEEFFRGISLTSENAVWGNGNDDWIARASETQPYDEYHQVYFYRETNNLKKLLVGDTTSPLIDHITIPSWGNEIDGVHFNLTVKAYAVQADYVVPGDDVSGWQAFFAKEFPNLQGDGSLTGRAIS
jgi:hypothetical protein